MSRPLPKRLSEVLRLAAIGKTDKEIALELNIGTGTVATHWKRLRAHFGTSSRTEVVARVLAQDSQLKREEESTERDRLLYEIAERERTEIKLREVNAQLAEMIRSREELLSKTMAGYEMQHTQALRRLEELEVLNRIVCDFGILASEGWHGNSWRKTWVSEAMEHFGYTQEQVLNGEVTVFNTVLAEDLARSLEDCMQAETPHILLAHRFVTKDGDHRHLIDLVKLEPLGDDGLGRATMVAVDVTDWLPMLREKIADGWPDLPLRPRVSPE